MFTESSRGRQELIPGRGRANVPAVLFWTHRMGPLALAGLLTCAGVPSVPARAQVRVGLPEVATHYGLECTALTNGFMLNNRSTTLGFELNSRRFTFNGLLFYLNAPLLHYENTWSIHQADAEFVIDPLFNPGALPPSSNDTLVVLDPGHGGEDEGASGLRKTAEGQAVLDIARRCQKALKGRVRRVVLTRTRNQTLSLADRAGLAARVGATVFVSIHLNSAANRSASGIETYTLPLPGYPSTSGDGNVKACAGNRYDAANTALAHAIHRALIQHTERPDRGVRRARFGVLQRAPCPAVLVECGFLSNVEDENLIVKRDYRQSVADGIAQGIVQYLTPPAAPTPP